MCGSRLPYVLTRGELFDMSDAIQRIVDRQEITDLIHQYCRGCDRADAELLNSVFWPDATVDHPPFKGSASEFCKIAIEFICMLDAAMHQVGNILIEFDGDTAYTESLFTGYHRIPRGPVKSGMLAESVFSFHREEVDEDVFMAGRYLKWFERRDGIWKISHHIGFLEWERWEEAAERSGFPRMATRDRNDPSYWRKKK